MLTLLTVFHLIFALGLILFVLIQDPKDGAMGVFGGGSSSNSFFGSTGAATFMTKLTTWFAICFAGCCIALAYQNTHRGTSVMDRLPMTPATPATQNAPATQNPATTPGAPAAPAQQAPAQQQQNPPASGSSDAPKK